MIPVKMSSIAKSARNNTHMGQVGIPLLLLAVVLLGHYASRGGGQ